MIKTEPPFNTYYNHGQKISDDSIGTTPSYVKRQNHSKPSKV